MKIIIKPSYEKMCKECANIIQEEFLKKKNLVLGLPTGNTPIGVYKEIVKLYNTGKIDFSEIITFNLDEFIGIPSSHRLSYSYYMYNHLFNHVNINLKNINIPNGMELNINKHCKEYEQKIKLVKGIDLQILGIGRNGHIGFNEPGSSFNSRTRKVSISEETIKDTAKSYGISQEEIPKFAITMGIKTIMESKKIILLANGKSKAAIIKKTIEGSITPDIPASVLKEHPNLLIILDNDAASMIL